MRRLWMEVAAFAVLSVSAAEPWPNDLWLGRGGWWTERIRFSVREEGAVPTNRLSAAYALRVGEGKGEIPLAGTPIDELRLCGAGGKQLVYGVWTGGGERLSAGRVPAGATVVVPSPAPTNAVVGFAFYRGNAAAWGLADSCATSPTGTVRGTIAHVEPVERIDLREEGATAVWATPSGKGEWLWRVPVRVVNATAGNRGEAIAVIPVRSATRSAANPVVEVWACGVRRWHHRVGQKLYFRCPSPAMSAVTAYVYVREAAVGEKSVLAFRASRQGLASDIPSDNVVKEETAEDRAVLAKERGVCVAARPADPECPPGEGTGLAVASVSVTRKVFPETPVRDAVGPFRFAMARNETEELQLAVRSPTPVIRLEADVSPLVAASGAVLTASVAHVECVKLDAPTAYYSSVGSDAELRHPTTEQTSEGWAGWWPDPIVPGTGIRMEAGRAKAFRLAVTTDAGTESGVYRGCVVWRADGREVRRDAVELSVWDFALPERAAIPAIYDFSGRDRRWWRPGEKTNSGALERMWHFMAAKRLCPNGIASRIWLGRDKKDGRVVASFREWDRLAGLYFGKFGFPRSYMPEEFWAFGWAHPPRKFLGEAPYEGAWPYRGVDRSKLRPAYRAAYQEALRLFLKHVESLGLKDRFELYLADEPYVRDKDIVPQMKALCEMVHEVDPSVRIYSSTWRHQPVWDDSLDIWGAGHFGNFDPRDIADRIAAGKTVWFTTDGQFALDTVQATAERMLPHYCDAFGVKAYEFWNLAWYTNDPWECGFHRYIRSSGVPGVRNRYVRYPNGDGYLVYPPRPGRAEGPVSSLRLESAREGVEDFACLKLLERLAGAKDDPRAPAAAKLLTAWRGLCRIPNPGARHMSRILPDPEELDRLRRETGALLSRAKPSGGRHFLVDYAVRSEDGKPGEFIRCTVTPGVRWLHLPPDEIGWRARNVCFVPPSCTNAVDPKVEPVSCSGTFAVSSLRCAPVEPVYERVSGERLGEGERIVGRRYRFAAPFSGAARNASRPFVDARNALFDHNRQTLSSDGELVYRFSLAAHDWKTASLAFSGRPGQAWTVMASADGRETVAVAETSAQTGEVAHVTFPATLFPAKELTVRMSFPKGGSVNGLFFEGDLAGAPMTAYGLTRWRETAGGAVVSFPRDESFETACGERVEAPSSACDVWTASSAWKVTPTRPLPKAKTGAVRLSAAANEAEAVQLVVTPRDELADVRVACGPLEMRKGESAVVVRLPAEAVDVRRVGYVQVETPSDLNGGVGSWPDPLFPQTDDRQGARAGENCAFWIRVTVPKGTKPGIYVGTLQIRVTRPGKGTSERFPVPLELTVFGFELPEQGVLATAFGDGLSEVTPYLGWKTESEKRCGCERFLRSMHDHRLSPYNPAPMAGPPKISWVNAWKRQPENVRPTFDWTRWDREMESAFARYPRFRGFRIGWIAGLGYGDLRGHPKEPLVAGVWERGTPGYETVMANYLPQVEAHLAEKGWLDQAYFYQFDEPPASQFGFVSKGFATLRKYAPRLTRLLTREPQGPLLGGPNLWCPLTYRLDSCPENVAAAKTAGDRFWWYICCGPRAHYATEFIDKPGTELRVWLWQTWMKGIEGVLIWNVNYWSSAAAYPDAGHPQDPYVDPMSWNRHNLGTWGNGEGRYFYPPREADGCPIESLRLEILRDGIEDYEYFALLKRLLAERGAKLSAAERAAFRSLLSVPKDVAASLTTFTDSPEPIEAHRAKLARAIERLVGSGIGK